MTRPAPTLWLLGLLALSSASGCAHIRGLIAPGSGEQGARARFHMRDGGLYVLRDWRREEAVVHGTGERYDLDRRLVDAGRFTLPTADVSTVESSQARAGAAALATGVLALLTAASVAVAGVCVLVPSAGCYGGPR